MILTFGRYKGTDIRDMPTSYLAWLVANDKGMRDYVREAIREEVKKRELPDVSKAS